MNREMSLELADAYIDVCSVCTEYLSEGGCGEKWSTGACPSNPATVFEYRGYRVTRNPSFGLADWRHYETTGPLADVPTKDLPAVPTSVVRPAAQGSIFGVSDATLERALRDMKVTL
jgi:hypothetical protein